MQRYKDLCCTCGKIFTIKFPPQPLPTTTCSQQCWEKTPFYVFTPRFTKH